MNDPIKSALNKGISYGEYREMIKILVEKGATTGPNQSEDMAGYTKMNDARMRRLDKTTSLVEENDQILSASPKETWLIITEAWCGDAAQIIPVINKMAEQNSNVQVKLVLRDENEALINQFLTNGGKAIPIIIVIGDSGDVLGHWGPRPSEMQNMVLARKEDPNATPYSEFVVEAQKWYAKDKTMSIQHEFATFLKACR